MGIYLGLYIGLTVFGVGVSVIDLLVARTRPAGSSPARFLPIVRLLGFGAVGAGLTGLFALATGVAPAASVGWSLAGALVVGAIARIVR